MAAVVAIVGFLPMPLVSFPLSITIHEFNFIHNEQRTMILLVVVIHPPS